MTIIERINATKAASLFHSMPGAAVSVYLSKEHHDQMIEETQGGVFYMNRSDKFTAVCDPKENEPVGKIADIDVYVIKDELKKYFEWFPKALKGSLMKSEVHQCRAVTILLDEDSISLPQIQHSIDS